MRDDLHIPDRVLVAGLGKRRRRREAAGRQGRSHVTDMKQESAYRRLERA